SLVSTPLPSSPNVGAVAACALWIIRGELNRAVKHNNTARSDHDNLKICGPNRLLFRSEILTVGVQLITTDYFAFTEAIPSSTEIPCNTFYWGPFSPPSFVSTDSSSADWSKLPLPRRQESHHDR